MALTPEGHPFPQRPKPIERVRLDAAVYDKLVKQCPTIAVNNDTAPLQAGFQLGAQFVLQKLREGFVVGL